MFWHNVIETFQSPYSRSCSSSNLSLGEWLVFLNDTVRKYSSFEKVREKKSTTLHFTLSILLLLFSNGFALHHAYFAYSANFSASISLKLFISNHKPLLHPSWEGCQQIHWILFPCTRNRGSLEGHTKFYVPLITTLLTSRSRTYVS